MQGVNVELETNVAALSRELKEAREQQAATGDILRIISRSTTDAQPVFEAIVESAAKLCSAEFCFVDRFDGELLHFVAHYGATAGAVDAAKRLWPVPPGRGSAAARAAATRAVAQIPDIEADPDYEVSAITDSLQVRSALAVPMLKEGMPIGVISIVRREAGFFPDRQVEVLKTFADQAVIAMDNARLFEEVQARNRDLSETLEQQLATSAILSTIARSSTDIQPVLDVVAKSAAQLCNAFDATIYLRGSDWLAVGAHSGPIPINMTGLPLVRDVVTSRSVLDRSPIHIHDLTTAGDEFETGRKMAQSLGFRTILAVPLLRQDEAIGALMIRRTEVLPFTDKQIDLLKTFADQAVIAIENVRLLTELGEALTQQTATADVLKVISRSTFDLQAVLDELSVSVARLCEADSAAIAIRQATGEYVELASFGDLSLSMNDFVYAPERGTCVGRVLLEGRTIQIADVLEDPEYTLLKVRPALDFRTALGVPMLREGVVVGVFALTRSVPRVFSQKQVELVEIFADQAVIAIENVRLFEEVQARNREVTEALEQQTATAEVLKTISNSAFDLDAVLHTLVKSASDLCHAPMGCIYLRDGDIFRTAMQVGWTQEFLEYMIRNPMRPGRGSASSRAALTGSVVQIRDVLADPEYTFIQGQQVGLFRTLLGVPLLRDGVVTGVFVLARPVVQPFSQREIELVQTFSDQAVIALENVRLFGEVQARTADLSEALQQQTATADVLKVISRSAFDLQSVLDTLTESAIRLCRADKGCLERLIEGDFRYASTFGFPPGFRAYADAHPTQIGRGSAVGRAAIERHIVHIEDVLEDSEYTYGEIAAVGAMRTVLAVPLLRQEELIGAFALIRTEARPFTAREIELVKTFADQAVIAIENVRLFDQVQARTKELARSLEDLRTAQDRLIQTEKLASLGQLTAGIAHEIKNPLNFVNNFSSLSAELIDELREVLGRVSLGEEVRKEIDELTGLLRGNLDKVVQHGKRADSIVKNMLLHSRAGSGEHRPTSVNTVVEESLNLAYHGARSDRKDFNITLERDFDPTAGEVDLYPQETTRALLNLISNGFYATVKRVAEANGAYRPVLTATTKNLGDSVEIRIRDNGTGIPPEVKERMFNPFFTTKPAGEGTGLGLSLSHDIIVKQHAGTIEVDTKPGEFTEFRIVLPRSAASLGKKGGEL